MDWNGPLFTDIDFTGMSPSARFQFAFGHYDARVYLSADAYIDVGAGSFSCEKLVTMVSDSAAGSLGRIGRFCEFGACEIMATGQHNNDSPVNIGFGCSPLLAGLAKGAGLAWEKATGPIDIGDNVIISSGAKILPGAKVATGCVIGAGAIVAKDTEPFGVYAGIPAARIKDRKPCQPWWNFASAYIAENMASLPQLARSQGPHLYRVERPRFVFRRKPAEISLTGWLDGKIIRKLSEAPERVRSYLAQAFDPNNPKPYWLADCWSE